LSINEEDQQIINNDVKFQIKDQEGRNYIDFNSLLFLFLFIFLFLGGVVILLLFVLVLLDIFAFFFVP